MSHRFKRFGLALALLALMWGLTGSEGAGDWLSRGVALAGERYYTHALACYQAAASWHPRDATPHARMGQVYMAQKRYALAEEAFWQAHLLSPRHVAALAGLGRVASAQGLDAQAVDWYHAALAIAPERADLLHALGEALGRLGRWEEAHLALTRAAALSADREVYLALAALTARTDLDAARTYLLAASAGHDDELANRASTLLSDLDKAAMAEEPGVRAGLLGLAYLRQRMWPLAQDALARALAAHPENGELLAFLGYVHYQQGRMGMAVALGRQAAEMDAENVHAHHLLGMAYGKLGWPHDALGALAAAYALEPRNPAIAAEIAQAYGDAGAYDLAEDWFAEAVRLAPDSADYALLQAAFHIERAYRVQAQGIPAAQRGLELSPDNASAHYLLGRGRYLVGDAEGAIQALMEALTLDPYLATAHYYLAEAHFSQGAWAAARASYGRVVDMDDLGRLRPRALARLQEMEQR